ncbi:MAG: glycosyltransferase family A protein [Acidocella sp.]|nr:glycosyltransferase family A protein [Acidocella sp.]
MTFSVIIPLFNKAPHIAVAVSSALAQSLPPDEIIVVDDGSTDNGAAAVANLTDRRIILIRQSNQGVSAARNAGVAAARSSHVAFLDADDAWLPQHLETLHNLITLFPAAHLYSTMYEIHLGAVIFRPKSAYPYGFVGMVDDFFYRMAIGLSLVNSTTACITRQAFDDVGGFPLNVKRGEDLVFWMKLAQRFPVAHATIVTAIYNRDAVNRSVVLREQAAPGSLLYLQSIIAARSLNATQLCSARSLFRQIAFYTAAGMREAGDIGGLIAIRKLAGDMNMRGLMLKISLLAVMPRGILSLARRFRHETSKRSAAPTEISA